MDLLAPRAYQTCTGDKQWYTCSANDYEGCCSMDPCDNGVCTDDDDTATTKSTSTSKSSTTTSASTSPTSHSTSSEATTTTKTTSQVTDLAVENQSSAISAVSSTSTSTVASTTSSNATRGVIIGGVIAGVVVALLVIGILIFWCRKRKRQQRQTLNLDEPLRTSDTRYGPYGSSPKTKTKTSYPLLDRHNTGSNIPIVMSGGLSSPTASGSTLSLPHTAPPGFRVQPPLSARRQQHPPELPDTALQQTRAELAPYSQKELINLPLDQRQQHKQREPAVFSWVATPTAGLPRPDTPPDSPASVVASSFALPSSSSVKILRDRPPPKPSSIAASSVALPSSSSVNIVGEAPQPSSPTATSISSPSAILNTRLQFDNTPLRPSNSLSPRQNNQYSRHRQPTNFLNMDSSPYSERSDTRYSPQSVAQSASPGQRRTKDRKGTEDQTFFDDDSIHPRDKVPAAPRELKVKNKVRY
ncbi:hypothetical protein N7478_001625 [Penicillium angulare]|uniref:uncharacterized protein n=1 Tax=Penicillium angulare TaxID=116970 RepID=UPI0025423EBE|nr:uncharacterized protein N7478_001625 [Penicillium angulare]KAJ5288595.1 hypothetical protein N7478_001625 [Penicillium angulare]